MARSISGPLPTYDRGGFDAKYAPAYYEETDLALKVRWDGYKVLYEPLSEVIHYEGATSGTDPSCGTKKASGG
jgi:GT2 family glycosyltransferase